MYRRQVQKGKKKEPCPKRQDSKDIRIAAGQLARYQSQPIAQYKLQLTDE